MSQKKLNIILNLYKLTLRHAIWKIFSRYKKPTLRNIFAIFRSDIPTLLVFIEIWIYQKKLKARRNWRKRNENFGFSTENCPGLVCFLSSLTFKEVVAMQEAIAVQIKVGWSYWSSLGRFTVPQFRRTQQDGFNQQTKGCHWKLF